MAQPPSLRSASPLPIPALLTKITWTQELTFALISQMEKPENFRVLFGKQDKDDRTGKESKTKIHQSIARELFPQYAGNPKFVKTLGEHVKGKIEQGLVSKYRLHVKRLRVTGDGVRDDEQAPNEQTLHLLVGPDGPTNTTSAKAHNIWEEILQEFPYFERLHRILSTRPNITPPLIITGTGPHGHSIIYNETAQPKASLADGPPTTSTAEHEPFTGTFDLFPSAFDPLVLESLVDPSLTVPTLPPANWHSPSPPPLTQHSPSLPATARHSPTPSPSPPPPSTSAKPRAGHKPKSSSFSFGTSPSLDAAVAKAKEKVQRIPAKRGIEEVLADHLG
ncbi:hypothetical protein PLEOSDRAFT_1109809 [Pleurotus ostreatus PC15]|uniref:Uncharacterized protein n=2 Tax=Pleurotus TaxID=5320 RepID=A0A067N4C4_PLEO1|nr:hypothetical protein CCMSSC00406_0003050 [Pleurotus cornucopiae]KDQ22714.1 hypothetical protein PLEOSDRAFT_1109809 [Pleurotus ostreatus PC15]